LPIARRTASRDGTGRGGSPSASRFWFSTLKRFRTFWKIPFFVGHCGEAKRRTSSISGPMTSAENLLV